MRLNIRMKKARQFWTFAFYPKTTLIACTIFFAIVIAILGIAMATVPQNSNWYNIIFALTTGAAGSFFVSFVVELAANYRHNKLAWFELQEYYSAVMKYESYKQIKMKMTLHQRAEKKAYEEFVAAGGIKEIPEYDKPKDIIQITWQQLPELIPVLKRTFNDKKEFLSDEEIIELKCILTDYEHIQSEIQICIMRSQMTYDALNHPDEDYLKSIYPSDVIKNMPEWIRKYLSSEESQKACDLYAEAILSDWYLLSEFMKNYDISQKGISDYQNELDRAEEAENKEPEETDYDELDFSEPDDEETFRAQNEEFDRQMELRYRPFVSWHLSSCCKNISESLDILEKNILEKPYYGMMIKYFKNLEKEPLDDIGATMAYESEKSRLDKKLEKQREKDLFSEQ